MSDLNRQLFDHVHNAGQSDVTRIITSGAHTLAPYERHVNVVMTGLTADVELTLPNAAEVPGAIFTIFLQTEVASYDTVVTGPGVGSAYSSGDLDAAGDHVVVISDGLRWIQLVKVG